MAKVKAVKGCPKKDIASRIPLEIPHGSAKGLDTTVLITINTMGIPMIDRTRKNGGRSILSVSVCSI